MPNAVVIGGGISGLASAYYLRKFAKPFFDKVLLLEATTHIGGWIQSIRLDSGAIYELGPRSLRPVGVVGGNTLKLAEDLGLSNDIIYVRRGHSSSKNRYIYVNDKLNALPTGALGALKVSPPFSRSLASMVYKEALTKKSTLDDESIHDFISRRFGTEFADFAVDPLCRGIYAGSSKKLSIKSCFPDLFRYEQMYGSIVKGALRDKKKQDNLNSSLVNRAKKEKWATWSLKNGLQQLTDQLQERVIEDGVDVHTETPCSFLEFSNGKIVVGIGEHGFEADHVFSSIYAQDLAPLLFKQHPALSELLNTIPAVSVAVVNIEYSGLQVKKQGFGHLIPSSESPGFLGIVYDSCAFPQHNATGAPSTRITCMLGGAWFREVYGDADTCRLEDLVRTAVKSAAKQLDITSDPVSVSVAVHKNCIPQYVVGHSVTMKRISSYLEEHSLPLSLVGSSYLGVSVNDCIYNAKVAVQKATFDKYN